MGIVYHVVLLLSMFLLLNHAKLMVVCNTSLVAVLNALHPIVFSITVVKSLTVWSLRTVNVYNVILTSFSDLMVPAYLKMSFVMNMTRMVSASSACKPITILTKKINVSKKHQDAIMMIMIPASNVISLSLINMVDVSSKDVLSTTEKVAMNASILISWLITDYALFLTV